MSDFKPYPNVDGSNRLEVNRLRSAAKRGDKRAEATLEVIAQQAHTAAWEATEQARADREAERANRKRHTSVDAVMDERKKAREAKEADRKKRAEEAEQQTANAQRLRTPHHIV